MYTVFITGANRGIGLEFVRQYAHDNYKVFAAYLQGVDSSLLHDLADTYSNIVQIPLDISNEKQIMQVAQQMKNQTIDILINNAGIRQEFETFATITTEKMNADFMINTVGPLLMAKYFWQHVAKSKLKTIASLSSLIGSISANLTLNTIPQDAYAYSASKAALNMTMSNMAIDGYKKGIKVLLLSPGLVATAMGKNVVGEKVDIHASVSGMRTIILQAPQSLEAFFYNYYGEILPW